MSNILNLIPNKKFWLAKTFLSWKKFTFNGHKISYFFHLYNHTFLNERTVEIAIFKKIWLMTKKKKVLEIGNVLSHYFPIKHTVVDKYELAPGIINADILTFKPKNKYDIILSISTFEHIGFDEEIRDPQKIKRVIKHLKTLLTPKGKIIFSIPIGYNPDYYQHLKDNQLGLSDEFYLQRTSALNDWRQCTKDEALKSKYYAPYNNGNAILIGVIENI